jgi:Protein of unknown function (DUF2612)
MSITPQNYLKLITSEHNQKPNYVAFISALIQATVDQQNNMQGFPALFDVDTAVGDQLDKIGVWVGVSRILNQTVNGISILPDNSYRILIKLFIAMNHWDGTVPGIYSIWDTIFSPEGYKIIVQDNQDMTMFVVFLNPPSDTLILAILTQGYFLLRSAGVMILGYFQPSLGGVPIFGFSSFENSLIAGFGHGAWLQRITV